MLVRPSGPASTEILRWVVNEMVESFQRDFKQIALWLIRDAKQWKPFRRDLIAKRQPCDLDLGELVRYAL